MEGIKKNRLAINMRPLETLNNAVAVAQFLEASAECLWMLNLALDEASVSALFGEQQEASDLSVEQQECDYDVEESGSEEPPVSKKQPRECPLFFDK